MAKGKQARAAVDNDPKQQEKAKQSKWQRIVVLSIAAKEGWAEFSNSRLVENRSDTVGKEQLASLAFRSDSMLAVDGCSLVFLEGRVFN